MRLFGLLTSAVEGVAEIGLNAVKVVGGVIVSPLDDGETIKDGARGIVSGVRKIGADGSDADKKDQAHG